MNVQHIDVFCGENRTQTLFARDYSNAPVNLTGLTITWSVSKPPNDPNLKTSLFSYFGTIVNAATGEFTVPIAPGDTTGLTPGDYFHQAFTTTAGGLIAVVLVGRFRLRAFIQQAA